MRRKRDTIDDRFSESARLFSDEIDDLLDGSGLAEDVGAGCEGDDPSFGGEKRGEG